MVTKTILLSATWCGPCKAYGPTYEKTMKEEFPEIEALHLDVESEEGEKIVDKYGLRGVPTTLFFNGDDLLKKESGNIGREKLINIIKEL